MSGIVASAGSPAASAAPPKVRVVPVATLANPVGFTFTPNGRIVYLERDTGEVRFLNPRTGSDRLFFRIGGVNSDGERGALGVALHPDWPRTPFVYVYVTRGPGSEPIRNQLDPPARRARPRPKLHGVAAVTDRIARQPQRRHGSCSAPTASSTS